MIQYRAGMGGYVVPESYQIIRQPVQWCEIPVSTLAEALAYFAGTSINYEIRQLNDEGHVTGTAEINRDTFLDRRQ